MLNGRSRYRFTQDFKQIGAWYKTLDDYENAKGDKFQGKFYCRVQVTEDNRRTHYYRNHLLIAKCIEEIGSIANRGEIALEK